MSSNLRSKIESLTSELKTLHGSVLSQDQKIREMRSAMERAFPAAKRDCRYAVALSAATGYTLTDYGNVRRWCERAGISPFDSTRERVSSAIRQMEADGLGGAS